MPHMSVVLHEAYPHTTQKRVTTMMETVLGVLRHGHLIRRREPLGREGLYGQRRFPLGNQVCRSAADPRTEEYPLFGRSRRQIDAVPPGSLTYYRT